MDRSREAEHLGLAEAHIAEGEARVTEQAMRIEKSRADGHDTTRAEAFLRTLELTLAEWRGHRDTILSTIARIDAGLIEHARAPER